MLTSRTYRKSAHKPYFQLILGKSQKSLCLPHKTVLCACVRGMTFPWQHPGEYVLLERQVGFGDLRVPLASLLPVGGPKAAATHWWMVRWALTLTGREIFSSVVLKPLLLLLFIYLFIFIPLASSCSCPPSASVCFSANAWARELNPCVISGKYNRTSSEMKLTETKVKNSCSRQWLPLKGLCGYDIFCRVDTILNQILSIAGNPIAFILLDPLSFILP